MKSETLKLQLMDQVIRFIGGRIERARAAQVEAFVRQFYANVPFADIAQNQYPIKLIAEPRIGQKMQGNVAKAVHTQ